MKHEHALLLSECNNQEIMPGSKYMCQSLIKCLYNFYKQMDAKDQPVQTVKSIEVLQILYTTNS